MFYETFHFPGIDSTNSWALSNTHLLPRDKITLVYAKKQSDGRGRHRNKWSSPDANNLYATFGVFIPLENGVQPNLPQLIALAAVSVMEKMGVQPKIKWPNDLLIQQKKVAGILTETSIDDQHIFHAIGIGVNLNLPQEQLKEIDRPATSLSVELKREIDLDEFLERLKETFSRFLTTFLEEGFTPYLPAFKAKLKHQENQELSFHQRDHQWKGKFHSINDDGTLNLKLETGEVKRFVAGEVQD